MNRKVVSNFFSKFSLKSYGIWTYVVCFLALAIGALTKYIEIRSIWEALVLLVWPIYGTWLFLRYFAFEMIAYETVIPSWLGYLFFLFFIGWGVALLVVRKKRIRNIIILLLLLFSLAFVGGCTYMTASLSLYGLI